MKKLFLIATVLLVLSACKKSGDGHINTSAKDEQKHTEKNQQGLNSAQPAPDISWSLERDNLIKKFRLENDRSTMFYMYVFIEGVSEPIGYYQVNKISSVNSQLTNPFQMVEDPNAYYQNNASIVLPSPAEDGSYGSNGDGVFGFTPEDIYIEHNMKYITATVPLHFTKPVNRLTIIDVATEQQLHKLMDKIEK